MRADQPPVEAAQVQTQTAEAHRGTSSLLILLLLAAATRGAWLVVLPSKAVALDLLTWKWVALDVLNGINPWAAPPWLNHPPFWTEVIFALANLSRRTGADFIFSIRLVLIAGDLCLLSAVYFLMRTLQPRSDCTRVLTVGYCLNPLLVLLTVQHGNFDAFSMIWVALFLTYLVQFRRSRDAVDWLTAAGCLGLAVYVKQFPLVLWPLLAPGARRMDWRGRIAGALLVVAPAGLSLLPLYVLSPAAVMQNVVGYRSLGNTFGIVGLLTLAGAENLLPAYSHLFTALVMMATLAMAVMLWRRDWRFDADPVLFSAMFLLMLFTVGPGYGSQYWFWVVPLLVTCYPNFGKGFSRVIWVGLMVVAATTMFEYGVEQNLGQYLYYFTGSERIAALGNYFLYPSVHLNWLRVPMSLAAFWMMGTGVVTLTRRYKGSDK